MRNLLLPLCFWTAISSAASLTICGVADGAAGDSDGAVNGVIGVTCVSAGGRFTGTIREAADPQTYVASISGLFYGTGSFNVAGQYSLFGEGDFYPLHTPGTLNGPAGSVAPTTAVITVAGDTIGPRPVFFGTPLPVPVLPQGAQAVVPRNFTGLENFEVRIAWSSGGPDLFFDFSQGGPSIFASTAPGHLIPEPSTLALAGVALVGCWLARRRSQIP